jgi:hypothetical protein
MIRSVLVLAGIIIPSKTGFTIDKAMLAAIVETQITRCMNAAITV